MSLVFPSFSASNLDGRSFDLPQGLEGELNLVIVVFRREHQVLIDGWVPHLSGLVWEEKGLAFYELPVIHSSYSMFRRWIDGGMRAGISDAEARKRTITLYVDKRALKRRLEIPDEDTIHLFLIDRNGRVAWRGEGGFTDQKLMGLKEALKSSRAAREVDLRPP